MFVFEQNSGRYASIFSQIPGVAPEEINSRSFCNACCVAWGCRPQHTHGASFHFLEEVSMIFNCHHCGINAFKLITGTDGHVTATCTKCGGVTPFEKSTMAEALSREATQMRDAAAM